MSLRRIHIAAGAAIFFALTCGADPNAASPTASNGSGNCAICFFGPDNLAFTADGTAYVTDNDHRGHFRVLHLDRTGHLLEDWRPFAPAKGEEGGPEGIAVDRFGDVWVTDSAARSVLHIVPSGRILERRGGFHDVGHVAVDECARLYVAEGGAGRVQAFAANGIRIANWNSALNAKALTWKYPEGLALLPHGQLAVEDWGHRRVVLLNANGRLRAIIGGSQQPGTLNNSSGIAADASGNIYVAETATHKIIKFGPSGRIVRTFTNDREDMPFTVGPTSVAVDHDGRIYAADGRSVVVLDRQGRLRQRWR